jgi:TetR/AcrR family transcriptional repressor of nem operon
VNETAEKLMDLAESHIRSAGYGGFSFRDLAAEIGIKSASVHHHFPTKATMATAVARRYADRFFAAVAPRPNETAEDAIAAYRSTFKAALDRDGLMCLFGVLGAEAGGLAPEVASEILSFFRRCIEDLSRRIGGPDREARGISDPRHARGRHDACPRLSRCRGIRPGSRRLGVALPSIQCSGAIQAPERGIVGAIGVSQGKRNG